MKIEFVTAIASAIFFLASMALALHLHLSQQKLRSAVPGEIR